MREKKMLHALIVLVSATITLAMHGAYRDFQNQLLRTEVRALQSEARVLDNAIEQLGKEGLAKDDEVRVLRGRIRGLVQEHEQSQQFVALMKQRIGELEAKVDDLLRGLRTERAVVGKLRGELAAAKTERDKTLAELAELRASPRVKDFINRVGDSANRPPSTNHQHQDSVCHGRGDCPATP